MSHSDATELVPLMVADLLPLVGAMLVLVVFSAMFSGSEAAVFSLRPRDRRVLARGGVAGRTIDRLLEDPERLLSAILFWNLAINVTYFTLAAMVGGRLEGSQSGGSVAAILFTVGSLLTIIFFSEMLPKSFAVLVPIRLSIAAAIPLSIAVRIISPLLPTVTAVNRFAARLVWPNFVSEPEIDLSDIERAIDLGTDDAAMRDRERSTLQRIVQIADIRVSEWMRPANQMFTFPPSTSTDQLQACAEKARYAMILDAPGEMIVEAIALRTLRPHHWEDPHQYREPVSYAPWSAKVSKVLDQLSNEDRNVAVIVNEFGEWVGSITADDILRRVLSPRGEGLESTAATIELIEEGVWKAGSLLSIRQLLRETNESVDVEGVTTISGWIARNNERLPRVGDQAGLGQLMLTVLEPLEGGHWIDVRLKTPALADHTSGDGKTPEADS
ncbi:MAG: CNNM domain-containing protein [Planctomycetota bacterium]